MQFYNMKDKPLAYDVRCNSKVVIPAGTTGVKIAFRQSHLTRYDRPKNEYVPLNVYWYKGSVYHA